MSEEPRKTRSPPARLASALSSNNSTMGSQSSVSSLASNLRETTLGGVQKAKFTPVVSARRAKKEPVEEAAPPVENKPRELRSGRGRGRGRGGAVQGGRGLLSDRRHDNGAGPAIISGPFSLGPMGSKSRQAVVNVGFAGGVRSGGGSIGSGRGFGGIGGGTRTNAHSSAGFTEESEVIDLDQIIKLEGLELGEDHCPVYIAAPSTKKMAIESDVRPSDILENQSQVLLIQMPTKLPALAQTEPADEIEGQPPTSAEDLWPANMEGEYGRLCVHESGKLSMVINGIRFFLNPGNPLVPDPSHVSGSQSIVAVDPDYEQSFELGQVHNSLIASLDLTDLFK